MLAGKDIICFAGEDWWYHNPHSNLHLMKAFAKTNRILFVNSIGTRMPDLRGGKVVWKKIFSKLKSMLRYCKRAGKNIVVLTPIAIPPIAKHEKLIEKINTVLLVFQLKIVCRCLGLRSPIFWVCIPSVQKIAIYLKKKFSSPLVYYCVDNIAHYSGKFSQYILDAEINLQKHADVAFFVNHQLAEERKQYNPRTFHLGHGVDYAHFAKVQSRTLEIPLDIAKINEPTVGYIGSITGLDYKLIKYLAQKNRDVSFVFIGSVNSDISIVKNEPNIYFIGKKDYALLPSYMQRINCFGIFYDINDTFNQYRNPKKLLEYLATGKPIVSCPILELDYFRDYIYVAKSYEEFSQMIKKAMYEDSPDDRDKRIQYAKSNTWDSVAAVASKYIMESCRYNFK